MAEDDTKNAGIESDVDVNDAFKRAHAGTVRKKEPAKTKVALELNPPGPGGMGQGGGALVSPQLREDERDIEREEELAKMRLRANFSEAARDADEGGPLERMKRAAQERDAERDDRER